MDGILNGIIKFHNKTKHFGFIKSEKGEFHFSDAHIMGEISVGVHVEFVLNADWNDQSRVSAWGTTIGTLVPEVPRNTFCYITQYNKNFYTIKQEDESLLVYIKLPGVQRPDVVLNQWMVPEKNATDHSVFFKGEERKVFQYTTIGLWRTLSYVLENETLAQSEERIAREEAKQEEDLARRRAEYVAQWAAAQEAYNKECVSLGEKLKKEIIAKLGDNYKCLIICAGEYDDEGYYRIFVKKDEDPCNCFVIEAEYKSMYGVHRWGHPTDYAYETGVVQKYFDGEPSLKEMGFDKSLEKQYI